MLTSTILKFFACQFSLVGSLSPPSPNDNTTIISSKRWLSLPPTPKLPGNGKGHHAHINGIELWYDIFGRAKEGTSPVVLLHGGLANSDYWGHQIEALQNHYQVIAIDSRGHGRSTRTQEPLSYDLMSSDFVSLLDYLHIPKASFVGWSDGAISALNIVTKHPSRVDRVFAFAANYDTNGIYDITKDFVFSTYINRTVLEYHLMSPTPDEYPAFRTDIFNMWASLPNWTEATFKGIEDGSKIWIVDGANEEAVKREQQDDMARWIHDAGLLILPQVSHFAFLQAPQLFNLVLNNFLAL